MDTAPFAFEARRTADAPNGDVLNGVVARFKPGAPTYAELERAAPMDDAASDMAYRLNCAVQQCPRRARSVGYAPAGRVSGARRRRALTAASAAALDEADATVAALLARADFENGRYEAPGAARAEAVGEVGGLVLIDRRERKNTSPE